MIALNESIIECINDLLGRHNKTASELSNFTEINLNELENYLTEKTEISLQNVVKIARFFGLNLQDFLIKARIIKIDDIQDTGQITKFKNEFMNKYKS